MHRAHAWWRWSFLATDDDLPTSTSIPEHKLVHQIASKSTRNRIRVKTQNLETEATTTPKLVIASTTKLRPLENPQLHLRLRLRPSYHYPKIWSTRSTTQAMVIDTLSTVKTRVLDLNRSLAPPQRSWSSSGISALLPITPLSSERNPTLQHTTIIRDHKKPYFDGPRTAP